MLRKTAAAMLAGATLFSQVAVAHSEHDKARFVASDGADQGRCDNRFRPCKTIAYAIQQANKGDRVLVAAGQYAIDSSTGLYALGSELVPVLGGFSRLDHFQMQNPDANTTTLTGNLNPLQDQLFQQGFTVIADGKATSTEALTLGQQQRVLMATRQEADDCVNGQSAGFACQNVSLLSHLPLAELHAASSTANDIWGHVDLNTNREYAIIGMRRAITVVDVTDPANPVVVGSVDGQSTTWRDIKVYQYYQSATQQWRAYAYATADSASEGLTIIDLNDLANGVSLVDRDKQDTAAHNIYISNVDYRYNIALPGTTPQVHVLGPNNYGGAWRSYSLRNLTSLKASYSPEGATRNDYTHDASSVWIDDGRADRDCVNASDNGCMVMLDFNENELRLWDHTNTSSAVELGSVTYPDAQYTHSGWWSEDKQYVILHDELDEQRVGLNTTVHFFDISDLDNPVLVSTWEGPTKAIDHNGFVRGNRYYMSNYERGLTVLDISDPLAPTEVGFFDTFPGSNSASFNGAWGVYPFLPSGTILVSDINSGLYILRDHTVTNVASNTVGFTAGHVTLSEGDVSNVSVAKSGNQAFSVDYTIINGSASDADYQLASGTLQWSQGDQSDQSIQVAALADQRDEIDESFFVILSNPVGGSIASGGDTLQVTISGTGINRGIVSFAQETIQVRENQASAQIEVTRSGGNAEAISVNYVLIPLTATLNSDVESYNGTLTWNDGETGAKTLTLPIIDDDESESAEQFRLDLSANNPSLLDGFISLTVTIRDDESNQPPVANAGNDMQINTRASVKIYADASDPEDDPITVSWMQTGGSSVTLSDADTLEPSFTAPASATTLSFELTVTDEFGAATTDSVSITVSAPATQPTQNSSSGGGSMMWLTLLISGGLLYRARKK